MTPGTVAQQVPLSSTIFWSLLEFMSIELVMLSNHLILCCPLLLLPIILMSIICYSFFIISAALNCFIFPLILGYFEPMNLQRFSSSNQGRNKISWKSGAKETAFLSHLGWIWLLSGKKKILPAMQEMWVQFQGQEDPLEKEMKTHSSILSWKIS